MRGLSYEVGVEGWQWSEFWGVVAIRSERFPGTCFHKEMAGGGVHVALWGGKGGALVGGKGGGWKTVQWFWAVDQSGKC